MWILEWDPVWIQPGYGTGDFFFNATGLQWDDPEFTGWLGECSSYIPEKGMMS